MNVVDNIGMSQSRQQSFGAVKKPSMADVENITNRILYPAKETLAQSGRTLKEYAYDFILEFQHFVQSQKNINTNDIEFYTSRNRPELTARVIRYGEDHFDLPFDAERLTGVDDPAKEIMKTLNQAGSYASRAHEAAVKKGLPPNPPPTTCEASRNICPELNGRTEQDKLRSYIYTALASIFGG